jgi:outer membrane immunogenic protein
MLLCECAIFLVKGSNHSEIDSCCCSNVTEKASGFGYISLTLQGVGHIMKKTLLLLAISAAAVGSAQAADMPVKAPVYVAPFTWTGAYLGINAGYGTGESTGSEYCTTPAGVVSGAGCNAPMPAALSPAGGFVGGQIGYNYQTGLFVWGVEGDIQVSHINDSTGATPLPCCIPTLGATGYTLLRSENLDWFGTVRGRLGLAVWDRTLIYGTGGLMYGEEVVNFLVTTPFTTTYQAQSSGTHTGWVAGGGIEYAFTNKISAKVEGLYYDLGSETIAASNTASPFTETANFHYKGALVRLGANLKFGP